MSSVCRTGSRATMAWPRGVLDLCQAAAAAVPGHLAPHLRAAPQGNRVPLQSPARPTLPRLAGDAARAAPPNSLAQGDRFFGVPKNLPPWLQVIPPWVCPNIPVPFGVAALLQVVHGALQFPGVDDVLLHAEDGLQLQAGLLAVTGAGQRGRQVVADLGIVRFLQDGRLQ